MYGILNLNKPIGPTSRECVNRVGRVLPGIKLAHAGTLDPLASGVLVLLVGPAVRLMEEVHTFDKEYIGTFRMGQSSPSGDLETEVTDSLIPEGLGAQHLLDTLPSFLGAIEQRPPAYSAVRVDGKRAHVQARRGVAVDVPMRSITIHALELLDFAFPEFTLRVSCGTGTYMRSLGSDIARSLGTEAVMTRLQRTRVGPFTIDNSVSLEAIESPEWDQQVLPATLGAHNMPQWCVDDSVMRRILDGQRLPFSDIAGAAAITEVGANAGDCLGANIDTQLDRRGAVVDVKGVLRAIVERKEDGRWRCHKGIAHWDVLPS
ncbi:MAG: tRNA pseudouridine(55) synthase TruB [Pirellula sp.]